MEWFHEQQSTIVELAIKRRAEVAKRYKEEESQRSQKRHEKMVREKCRHDALHERAVKERDQLSQLHLITSCEELKKALSEIDELPVSVKKKSESKRALLREQINIRKKVL